MFLQRWSTSLRRLGPVAVALSLLVGFTVVASGGVALPTTSAYAASTGNDYPWANAT